MTSYVARLIYYYDDTEVRGYMTRKKARIFIIILSLFSIIIGVFYLYENTFIFCMNKIIAPRKIDNISKQYKFYHNKTRLDEAIEQGLLNVEETITIENKVLILSMEKIVKSIAKTINNNAEIMYYKDVNYSKGRLNVTYSKEKQEIHSHQIELRKKREKIIADIITEDMGEFEKIKSIHDYVIDNTKFDNTVFETGHVPPESYTAFGVLVLGVGVCEGYAKAVKYLLDGVDIESIVVMGQLDGENHAWNLIEIGEEYYHLDTTCNDPIRTDNKESLTYNYFNITDDDISASHKWDKEEYPLAVGSFYNFFNYKDLILYNEEEIADIIKNALLKTKSGLVFKYEKFNEDNINIDKIIKDIVYANCKEIKLNSYSYILDKNQGIYQIEFNYR